MIAEKIEITTASGKIFLRVCLLVGILFFAGCIIGSVASFFSGGIQEGFLALSVLIVALFIFLFLLLIRLFADVEVIGASANGLNVRNMLIRYDKIKEIKIYYGLYKVVIIKFMGKKEMERIVGILPMVSNRKYKKAINNLKRIKKELKI